MPRALRSPGKRGPGVRPVWLDPPVRRHASSLAPLLFYRTSERAKNVGGVRARCLRAGSSHADVSLARSLVSPSLCVWFLASSALAAPAASQFFSPREGNKTEATKLHVNSFSTWAAAKTPGNRSGTMLKQNSEQEIPSKSGPPRLDLPVTSLNPECFGGLPSPSPHPTLTQPTHTLTHPHKQREGEGETTRAG